MRAAVEPFVAINLVMNVVVLTMSARIASVGRIRPRRILLGAAAGTGYALATWTFFPLGPALFAPVTLLMAWSVAPTHSFGVLVRRSFIVLGCAFLCGGTAYAAAQALQNRAGALLLAVPAATLWLRRLVRTRIERLATHTVGVRCKFGADCVELDGIVDSGNRMVDAVTGLPVIVADARAAQFAAWKARSFGPGVASAGIPVDAAVRRVQHAAGDVFSSARVALSPGRMVRGASRGGVGAARPVGGGARALVAPVAAKWNFVPTKERQVLQSCSAGRRTSGALRRRQRRGF